MEPGHHHHHRHEGGEPNASLEEQEREQQEFERRRYEPLPSVPTQRGPPATAGASDISAADFVSDQDFERMDLSRVSASGEDLSSRRPPGEYHAPSYGPPGSGFPEPQAPYGSSYAPSYAAPAGPPPGVQPHHHHPGGPTAAGYPTEVGPGGFAPPAGPPPSYGGAPGGFVMPSVHFPQQPMYGGNPISPASQMAYAQHPGMDAAMYEEALQRIHEGDPEHLRRHPSLEEHKAHLAAYEQAFGPERNAEASSTPMDAETIGGAAVVQALKMSAAQGQTQGSGVPEPPHHVHHHVESTDVQHPAHHPTAGPHHTTQPATHVSHQAPPAEPPRPSPQSQDPAHAAPQQAQSQHAPAAASPAPSSAQGATPSAPQNPQDKLVALAMSQAAKLFDKQNGGASNPQANAAKMQAVQSAAQIALRLAGQYKSSGKVNLQQGDFQNLLHAAMAIL